MLCVGGLIDQPLDLKHHRRDKSEKQEKAQNCLKRAILDSGVHSNQSEQQQSWDAKCDDGQDEEGLRRFSAWWNLDAIGSLLTAFACSGVSLTGSE